MNLTRDKIRLIQKLCKEYKVSRLDVFGSALSKKFNSNSDIDLVVEFKGVSKKQYADNYFDFKYSLEDLLKREIDLLEKKAIKNPYLKESIDSNKTAIYEK